jgi:hypothetical protein
LSASKGAALSAPATTLGWTGARTQRIHYGPAARIFGHRPAWPSWFRGQGLGGRPEGAVTTEHARGEPFGQQRVVSRDIEMAKTALDVGQREGECARGRARLVVFLRQRLRRLDPRPFPSRKRA